MTSRYVNKIRIRLSGLVFKIFSFKNYNYLTPSLVIHDALTNYLCGLYRRTTQETNQTIQICHSVAFQTPSGGNEQAAPSEQVA